MAIVYLQMTITLMISGQLKQITVGSLITLVYNSLMNTNLTAL